MKRSEMINRLKFWIEDNTWSRDPDSLIARDHTDKELDGLAVELMGFIEEAGMKAPPWGGFHTYFTWEEE